MTLIESVDRYLRHHNQAVQFFLGATRPARFEPAAVLAHPDGPRAARLLAGRLRASRWANEPQGSALHDLALGELVDMPTAAAALGDDLVACGLASGLLIEAGPRYKLGFGVIALGDLMVPAPRELRAPDQIYFGPEALYLEDLREALGITSRVAYLGAGAGHLAVVLARRCEAVVATDLLPRAAAMTRLALVMNDEVLSTDRRPVVDVSAAVIVADLAAGLRPASVDLVLANPPWVPTPAGETLVYADGGPTGCELPQRFLRDAMTLVRPGGVVAMSTLDPTMRDGTRPWAEAIDAMNARSDATGFVVGMFPTPMPRRRADFEERLLAHQPRLRAARHVAVVALRSGGTEARPRLADLPSLVDW